MSEPYRLEIDLPGLPPINSADALHWSTRGKKRKLWKRLVWAQVVGKKPPAPLSRARVTITRCSSVEPDPANLGEGAKFVLDGLVECGVLADDNRETIGMPELLWEPAPAKKGHVRVVVIEATP
ncbi:MAG: hypothetical protein NXI30_04440 [bacterium]|nr:hypothetical protein [bacterium]